MDDIIRITYSIENSSVLIDGVNETVKHEMKKEEGEFFGMLLTTLCASVFGNMLTGKGVIRARKEVLRVYIIIWIIWTTIFTHSTNNGPQDHPRLFPSNVYERSYLITTRRPGNVPI